MSLVNLSHVCSHLQNASLARLGLTSIPYTRLHLSLSLLLQKQGFLSQVKLGGSSPPASCFPSGTIPERKGLIPNKLDEGLEEGYAAKWWARHGMKAKEDLEKEGWDSVAANWLLRHEGKSREELRHEFLPEDKVESMSEQQLQGAEKQIALVEAHAPLLSEARQEVEKWTPDPPFRTDREREAYNAIKTSKVKQSLLRIGFPLETLQHFAGPANTSFTPRDLEREGLKVEAMGLTIPNQPLDSFPPAPTNPNSTTASESSLEEEGVITQANRASRRLWLGLKYWDGEPVLRKARMLSKPTKRIWLDSRELGGLVRGKGAFREQIKPLTRVGEIMVVSTDRGIMEVREAAERKLGGQVLCRIW